MATIRIGAESEFRGQKQHLYFDKCLKKHLDASHLTKSLFGGIEDISGLFGNRNT